MQLLRDWQIEAYLVGGAVRDLLLDRETIVDLDFTLPDSGLRIARRVADALAAAYYPLDSERDTGRVITESGHYLDFAAFRGATLRADLADRDFTINAMALTLTDPPHLIDPWRGQRDLVQSQIRAVSPQAFAHDPVRLLRAVRQAAQFGFTIEAKTGHYLQQAAPALEIVSPERRRDELLKSLNTPAPGRALQLMAQLGILPYILPEIEQMRGVTQSPPHYLDLFDHTAAALESWAEMMRAGLPEIRFRSEVRQYLAETLTGNLTRRQLMPLALLWHDAGKPHTRREEESQAGLRIRFLGHEQIGAEIAGQTMRRLHFSNQSIEFVRRVVAHHMRPLLLSQATKLSRRAIYRLFRDTKEAGPAVALHALADHRATHPQRTAEQPLLAVVDRLLEAYFQQRDQLVAPPPLLSGRDLIERFDLQEGRLIGRLLRHLQEAQAVGQVQDREQALAFIEADPDFIEYRETND